MKPLLYAALIGAGLTASAAETVWWRTSGAAVIQLDNVCSLFIYTDTQAAIVTWNTVAAESIAFQDPNFQFEADERLAVAMRIDQTWLTGTVGYGNRHILTMPIDQSIAALLPTAESVSVKLTSYEITVQLPTAKMSVLLSAVEKCRAKLK